MGSGNLSQGSNIADGILGFVSQQPKQVITHPPLSGPDSGQVGRNVPTSIVSRPQGPYLPDGGVCVDPTPDSWDFQFVTLNFGVTGDIFHNSLADEFIQLPRPVRKIYIVGISGPIVTGLGVFLHFQRLNKAATASTSYGPVDGSENWIPFPGANQFHAQPCPGGGSALVDTCFIELCKPMSKLYVDVMNSGGATAAKGFNITFLFTDDIAKVYSNVQ
jgi:hypothetical protein